MAPTVPCSRCGLSPSGRPQNVRRGDLADRDRTQPRHALPARARPTTGFHGHKEDYLIVPIKSGSLLLKDADNEHTDGLESGKPYLRSDAIEHEAINAGSEELIFVEVELL